MKLMRMRILLRIQSRRIVVNTRRGLPYFFDDYSGDFDKEIYAHTLSSEQQMRGLEIGTFRPYRMKSAKLEKLTIVPVILISINEYFIQIIDSQKKNLKEIEICGESLPEDPLRAICCLCRNLQKLHLDVVNLPRTMTWCHVYRNQSKNFSLKTLFIRQFDSDHAMNVIFGMFPNIEQLEVAFSTLHLFALCFMQATI